MVKYDFHGDWYLLKSTKKYPGRLFIDEAGKTIRLEIFSNETIEGSTINKSFNEEIEYYHNIILGDCAGDKITLYGNSWARTQVIGNEMYQIDYKADFLFIGAHVINQNFLINSATFIYPYLASWYDGWKGNSNINSETTAEFGIKEEKSEIKIDNIPISDNLEIILFDKINKHMVEVGIKHSIEYQKYLSFNYKNPVSFQDIINDAVIFRKLLEFVFAKPVLCKMISINLPINFLSNASEYSIPDRNNFSLYVSNFTLNDGEDVKKSWQNQRYMLLSGWNCPKPELNEIIRKWFLNKHLYNIYDYYIDSNNWLQGSGAPLSNVMFNNRFLNVIQGLEDYYRKCINQEVQEVQSFLNKKQVILNSIKDPQLKKWLNDNFKPPKNIKLEEKIQAIIVEIKPLFLETITENPFFVSFAEYSKNKRNELSHGKNPETYQGDELHINFWIGQTLLGICILKTLGVTGINKKIKNYYLWNKNLNTIINYNDSNTNQV